MLTNAAIQYVLPAAAIAHTDRPAADADAPRRRCLGFRLRLYRHGRIHRALPLSAPPFPEPASPSPPPATASSSARSPTSTRAFHTPSTALILQASLTTLLLLAIGRFQALFSLAIFAEWLFYALTASTVYIFRRRDASATRPYSVWGYPVLPALFIGAAIVVLVFSVVAQPRNSLAGIAVILLGIPVHLWFRGRSR